MLSSFLMVTSVSRACVATSHSELRGLCPLYTSTDGPLASVSTSPRFPTDNGIDHLLGEIWAVLGVTSGIVG